MRIHRIPHTNMLKLSPTNLTGLEFKRNGLGHDDMKIHVHFTVQHEQGPISEEGSRPVSLVKFEKREMSSSTVIAGPAWSR
jgi:hypothetical protein